MKFILLLILQEMHSFTEFMKFSKKLSIGISHHRAEYQFKQGIGIDQEVKLFKLGQVTRKEKSIETHRLKHQVSSQMAQSSLLRNQVKQNRFISSIGPWHLQLLLELGIGTFISTRLGNGTRQGVWASLGLVKYDAGMSRQGKLLTLKVGLFTQEQIWNEMFAQTLITTGVSSSNWLFLELGKVVVVSQGQDQKQELGMGQACQD